MHLLPIGIFFLMQLYTINAQLKACNAQLQSVEPRS